MKVYFRLGGSQCDGKVVWDVFTGWGKRRIQLHLSRSSRWPHLLSTGTTKAIRHNLSQLPHQAWATKRAHSSLPVLGSWCVYLSGTHPTLPQAPIPPGLLSALHSLPPPCHCYTSICCFDAINPYSHPSLVPAPPVPKPNCLLLMSSWLPAYGFFITHPFNPIGNICCCQLPLLLKTFSWLPGAPLSSVSFMLFKNCFPFSALLVPLPLLSISLFKCWYLPCSVLVSAPFSSLLSWGVIILPMTLHIASAIHISFFSFLSTMLLHRKLSFVLQKSVQKPPPLGCLCWHQRQSWVRPTLFSQNNAMICFRVWYPHSEWET